MKNSDCEFDMLQKNPNVIISRVHILEGDIDSKSKRREIFANECDKRSLSKKDYNYQFYKLKRGLCSWFVIVLTPSAPENDVLDFVI